MQESFFRHSSIPHPNNIEDKNETVFRHTGPCICRVYDEFGLLCSNQFFILANSKRRQTNWQPNSRNCKIVIMESATSFCVDHDLGSGFINSVDLRGTQAVSQAGNQLKFISFWKIKLFHITFNFNSSKCNFIPNIHQHSALSRCCEKITTYHIAPLFSIGKASTW